MNALPLFAQQPGSASGDKPANILAAARSFLPQLARSRSLDRKFVAEVMTTSFGGTDADGAWCWRDAYDAIEASFVLQLRRLAPQLSRLEDAPTDIVALLAGTSALGLTHSRRSDEQLALDQFSTPPELAALAVLAAQVRPGDMVLEPSAGTGLLAIFAEACGAALHLNEFAATRAEILAGLFPLAARTRLDAVLLKDAIEASGRFDAAIVNPPFQVLTEHLHAAIDCLAEGGRLSAIVPVRLFEERAAMTALAARGELVLALAFPKGAYGKHGTSVETGLLVVDRGAASRAEWSVMVGETLGDAARAASCVRARPTAKPRAFRSPASVATFTPRPRAIAGPARRFGFLASAAAVTYQTKPWSGEGRDVGLYQAYALGRLVIPGAGPHVSPLVESGPMASVSPPAPTYRPVLPREVLETAKLSDAQIETVIYAGEAHSSFVPGEWILGEAPHQVELAREGTVGAVRFRKGFFLGDGTGCGKGRQIAGIVADNIAQGRERAIWLSKNDDLLEDARRDWTAIGGSASDIVAHGSWKQADAIQMERGRVGVERRYLLPGSVSPLPSPNRTCGFPRNRLSVRSHGFGWPSQRGEGVRCRPKTIGSAHEPFVGRRIPSVRYPEASVRIVERATLLERSKLGCAVGPDPFSSAQPREASA